VAYEVWAGVDPRGNGLVAWLNHASVTECIEFSRYTRQSGWGTAQPVSGTYASTCSDLMGTTTAAGDMVLVWRDVPMYQTVRQVWAAAFE
jgi:hypothetical protein